MRMSTRVHVCASVAVCVFVDVYMYVRAWVVCMDALRYVYMRNLTVPACMLSESSSDLVLVQDEGDPRSIVFATRSFSKTRALRELQRRDGVDLAHLTAEQVLYFVV
jgi:hypothetical protein